MTKPDRQQMEREVLGAAAVTFVVSFVLVLAGEAGIVVGVAIGLSIALLAVKRYL